MPGARNRFFGNVRSDPQWAADFGRGPEISLPFPAKIDPTQFSDAAGIRVIVGAAGAAASAVTVPVDAIVLPLSAANVPNQGAGVLIPAGVTLSFGAVGSKKFAKLTADVKVGDTSIAVEALPTALVDNDEARYNAAGTKTIPSGTAIGRTYAERDANTAFGAAVDTDDEIFLMLHDCVDAHAPGGDDVEVYRPGLTVKENYLPNYSSIAAGLLTKLRVIYRCIKGVD